jgi:hypothetical protein
MKNKYIAFAKNGAITITVTVAAGIGASEIAKEFTNDGRIIGATSTIAQYIASYSTFLPLHARDNRDIYTKNGKFDWKSFLWDNFKFASAFALLDLAYLGGRPFTQNYFLNRNMNATESSLASDGVWISAYLALAFPLARLTGIIKAKTNLETIAVQGPAQEVQRR